jgi:hypothetical protein
LQPQQLEHYPESRSLLLHHAIVWGRGCCLLLLLVLLLLVALQVPAWQRACFVAWRVYLLSA